MHVVFIVTGCIEIFYRLGRGHEWRVIHTGSISQVMYVVMMMLNALTVGANLDHSPEASSVTILGAAAATNVIVR